jgi:thiamine-monophosphate kinase
MGERIIRLQDLGEKTIIRDIVRPMLNAEGDLNSVGDDCALIAVAAGCSMCASTDRVPSDLISFRLGILDYRGLGNYLAVLNLSDLAAMGAAPAGLLLNLGLPDDLSVADFTALLEGARDACVNVGCQVVGGDLSSSTEISISATSLGIVHPDKVLRRSGARVGDLVYCSDYLGLSSTAFAYFLRALPLGLGLSDSEEQVLKDCFRKPRARFDVGTALSQGGYRTTAMDNTDGVAQTYSEIASASGVGIALRQSDFPIHDISHKVANFLGEDVADLVLGPGADFQLLGTIECRAGQANSLPASVTPIGRVISEHGVYLEGLGNERLPVTVRGWDYYGKVERAHTDGQGRSEKL